MKACASMARVITQIYSFGVPKSQNKSLMPTSRVEAELGLMFARTLEATKTNEQRNVAMFTPRRLAI